MFKLIAVIFVMSGAGGNPESISAMRYETSFDSKEACVTFFNSNKGQSVRASMDKTVSEAGVALNKIYKAKFHCVATEGEESI